MSNACTWVVPIETLVDGTQVSSNSEEWRAQCEAITIHRFTDGAKLEFFANVERKRGKPALDRLKRDMDAVEHMHILDHLKCVEARRAYLQRVESMRGANVRAMLEGRILALWKSRQSVENKTADGA